MNHPDPDEINRKLVSTAAEMNDAVEAADASVRTHKILVIALAAVTVTAAALITYFTDGLHPLVVLVLVLMNLVYAVSCFQVVKRQKKLQATFAPQKSESQN